MKKSELTILNNVRLYRRLNDLSKTQLGSMINRSARNIGQIENAETMPPLDIAWWLADILNLPVTELFFKKGEEPELRMVRMREK